MQTEKLVSRQEIDALADAIAEVAVQLDVATHTLLTHLRRFDEVGGWGRQGALTCAQWLSWRIGMGVGMARERVRIAHALGKLPLVDAAMARGELSYSKVRAITRTATEKTEATLVEMARCSTAAQLEKICRLCRARHNRHYADPAVMPRTGGPLDGEQIVGRGIIRGRSGRPGAHRRGDTGRAWHARAQ